MLVFYYGWLRGRKEEAVNKAFFDAFFCHSRAELRIRARRTVFKPFGYEFTLAAERNARISPNSSSLDARTSSFCPEIHFKLLNRTTRRRRSFSDPLNPSRGNRCTMPLGASEIASLACAVTVGSLRIAALISWHSLTRQTNVPRPLTLTLEYSAGYYSLHLVWPFNLVSKIPREWVETLRALPWAVIQRWDWRIRN